MKVRIIKLNGGAIIGATPKDTKLLEQIKNGVYEIEIDANVEKKAKRSTLQNRYYWGVVLHFITRHIDDSYTPEQLHEAFKMWYFGTAKVGNIAIPNGSTKHLSISEMEEYLSAVRQWASETLSLYIPKPNEIGIDYL